MASLNLPPHSRKTRRRAVGAYVFLDAVISLAILVTLTVLLGVALGQQRQATRHLADTREAVRIAEATLQGLRDKSATNEERRASANSSPDVHISIAPLSLTPQSSTAWAQITVVCRTGRATLVGPVRHAAEVRP